MKIFLVISFAFSTILCSSCECERYKCPAFSDSTANIWIPPNNLTFLNAATGQEKTFKRETVSISGSYGSDETTLALHCTENDCIATASYSGSTTESTNAITLNIKLQSDYIGKTFLYDRLNYSIGTMQQYIIINPTLVVSQGTETGEWYADSITDVNTGFELYSDVLIQTRKHSGSNEVAKTYWTHTSGLIGFMLGNNTTYWKK